MINMKNVFLLALIFGALLYLESCNNNNANQIDLKYIDTNFIVYKDKVPLKYYQYAQFINSGEYVIWRDSKTKLKLMKLPESYLKSKDNQRALVVRANLVNLERKATMIPVCDRALVKHFPPEIDTNRIIYDQDNVALKYYQYIPILFNNAGEVRIDKDGKYLWRFSEKHNVDNPNTPHNSLDTGRIFNHIYLKLLQADKVLVIKSARAIYLQRGSKTFLTFSCNLGGNPVGDKQQDGDRRTPEGFYTLNGETTKGKYGKGFLISYPDSAHIAAARQKGVLPGGEVMIHGTSAERSKLKDWTNGCIAISNANMEDLFTYVMPGTPIEIRK